MEFGGLVHALAKTGILTHAARCVAVRSAVMVRRIDTISKD